MKLNKSEIKYVDDYKQITDVSYRKLYDSVIFRFYLSNDKIQKNLTKAVSCILSEVAEGIKNIFRALSSFENSIIKRSTTND